MCCEKYYQTNGVKIDVENQDEKSEYGENAVKKR